MTHELLQNVRILDPESGTDTVADILIKEGVISAIQTNLSPSSDVEVQDAKGLILGPGLVDLYSHTGEPGFEERETISSLIDAATAGGFTRIALLPDSIPPVDNPATVSLIHRLAQNTPACQVYLWGALTQGVAGKQMSQLSELATTDIIGFADGQPIQDLILLRRLLEYLKPLNQPVALYACDRQLASNGVMREGNESILSGLPGIPAYAETTAISTILEIVAATQTPVHFMRVSTARSVELIRDAKARKLPITASTTWLHLLLNTQAICGKNQGLPFSMIPYDPNLNLDPPLGTLEDQMALIQGVKSGVIDAIAIDHTPYTYEEKTVAFADAPAGSIGLELALPLLWQTFVSSGQWSALELWQALSTKPLKCLGEKPTRIANGKPAELALFSPQTSWKVEAKTLNSLSINTSWFRQEITGKVLTTYRNNFYTSSTKN
ncbi:dihydroorotase [Lyngbya sp. PCC 8106]|uniref:dihydroorotase n=1 Tax=Lyngbya sp. (strain PCC 8106) TaxID=313612 RepID=UPI0000EAA204|nr:dihydroorotase [Lyngbya sp. PCC 8106]EAW36971.1 dihydroorotase [Lyngbya sp. PCC 8106]